MDYNAMLKMVRMQNPDMPFKEAQQLAKTKYAEFKITLETQKKNDPPIISGAVKVTEKPVIGTDKTDKTDKQVAQAISASVPDPLADPNEIPYMQLVSAEKYIRQVGVNRNSVLRFGKEAIPTGELVKHGKDGVNTLVTFEDKYGNKVPVTGYFRIFI
jgi:hypothetical protein